MIYTPSAARRDIVESKRKRHAPPTTSSLRSRAHDRAGHEWMMGGAVQSAATPVFHVNVLGTGMIESLEIIKDGKFAGSPRVRARYPL